MITAATFTTCSGKIHAFLSNSAQLHLCKLGKEYLNALTCKFYFFSWKNSATFDILHAFLPLTITELSTPQQVQFFGPPCIQVIAHLIHLNTYDVRRTAHGTELLRMSFVTAQTYLTCKKHTALHKEHAHTSSPSIQKSRDWTTEKVQQSSNVLCISIINTIYSSNCQ